MYYDRRLPAALLDLIKPRAPLAWLVAWVRFPAAAALHARIDWRRADGDRRHGGIQVYFGRTSPLEVVGRPRNHVEFQADKRYRGQSPHLFGRRWSAAGLTAIRADLEAHLARCGSIARSSFVQGEAISHAGMMRRYGLHHRQGDPLVAVDSEVRVGFRGIPGQPKKTGTEVREEHEARLLRALQVPLVGGTPRKLDTLGIHRSGDLALVEVKDEHGDLQRAVVQVAAHIFTFRALINQSTYNLPAVINKMVQQKVDAGLLPGTVPSLECTHIVPVVAAPDQRRGWDDIWRRETARVRKTLGPLLGGLQFWKLSDVGEVLEEIQP